MTLPLRRVAAASSQLRTTAGRNDKVAVIADLLAEATPHEAGLAARYLSGDPRQDRLEVGWAAVRDVRVEPARVATLSLLDVDAALQSLADAAGVGSRGDRLSTLAALMAAATADEQAFLRHLLLGEMRQGASAGVVVKAVAAAASVPERVVRRALMLSADLGEVTALALDGGRAALEAVGLTVGRGVQPMLASTAPGVGEVVAAMGAALVEWKLDGFRAQVHIAGDDVRVLTRNLNDVTERSRETVVLARSLGVRSAILDGEILAVGADGRPVAFQDTASQLTNPEGGGAAVAAFLFDLLHLDGEDLIDEPLSRRRERLLEVVPEGNVIPGRVVSDPADGEAVLAEALAHGHEGAMVKDLTAAYVAGRRGKQWRKVKPVRTLDLVVLGVEWGSGRRQGWLSNLHLGARADDGEGFVMLGKTFKGMTDAMLEWQTERFLELETHRDQRTVYVRPEQVVEIALDGVQRSTRYPGGVALRFARVVRYRDDKDPRDADRLATVRAMLP